MSAKTTTLSLAGFAVLLSVRDVLSDVLLNEDPICLAFLTCFIVSLVSILLFRRKHFVHAFLQKLERKRVRFTVFLLGGMAAIVYGVTFTMVHLLGAGLFGLIDFGLSPLFTAAVGLYFFNEVLHREFLVCVFLYLAGILLLKINYPMFGWELVVVALASPVATAASFGLSKWLLDPQGGNLTRSEVLLVRFLPASALLAVYAVLFNANGLVLYEPLKATSVALVGGFLPLWLLYSALRTCGLTELALWQFVIPGLSFLGTLPFRMKGNEPLFTIVGACLVISALVVGETAHAIRRNSKRSQFNSRRPGLSY